MNNNFGEEDLKCLQDLDMRTILKSHFRGIFKLFNYIYFNQNYKNNNTIKYIDENNIEIIDNGLPILMNKEYVLDSILLHLWSIIYNFYAEMEKNNKLTQFKNSLVCEQTWDRVQEFIDSYIKLTQGIPVDVTYVKEELFTLLKISSITNNINVEIIETKIKQKKKLL